MMRFVAPRRPSLAWLVAGALAIALGASCDAQAPAVALGAACSAPTDCPLYLTCHEGTCKPRCDDGFTCPSKQQLCRSGVCLEACSLAMPEVASLAGVFRIQADAEEQYLYGEVTDGGKATIVRARAEGGGPRETVFARASANGGGFGIAGQFLYATTDEGLKRTPMPVAAVPASFSSSPPALAVNGGASYYVGSDLLFVQPDRLGRLRRWIGAQDTLDVDFDEPEGSSIGFFQTEQRLYWMGADPATGARVFRTLELPDGAVTSTGVAVPDELYTQVDGRLRSPVFTILGTEFFFATFQGDLVRIELSRPGSSPEIVAPRAFATVRGVSYRPAFIGDEAIYLARSEGPSCPPLYAYSIRTGQARFLATAPVEVAEDGLASENPPGVTGRSVLYSVSGRVFRVAR